MKKTTLLSSLILLGAALTSGCAHQVSQTPQQWLKRYELPLPDAGRLTLCIDFGCTRTRQIRFSDDELAQVRQLFSPAPDSAEQEREQIAKAIGLFEQLSGPKLKTQSDLPGNQFRLGLSGNQLDCIAETSNTSNYLMLLEALELLQFYRPGGHAHRGLFALQAPHNSATIRERHGQQVYVVDAWFRANGEPAWITDLHSWQQGQSPD